jgi:hypothetical protein
MFPQEFGVNHFHAVEKFLAIMVKVYVLDWYEDTVISPLTNQDCLYHIATTICKAMHVIVLE